MESLKFGIKIKESRKNLILIFFYPGMTLKGLDDTGADVSCIDKKMFLEIPVNKRPANQLMDKAYCFKGAGDQDLNIRGRFTLPLKVGQKHITHEFIVI